MDVFIVIAVQNVMALRVLTRLRLSRMRFEFCVMS